MEPLLENLRQRFPHLVYRCGPTFCWSPETQEVFYAAGPDKPYASHALLHETSHALLGHTAYTTDVQLLQLEVAAWQKAAALANELGITLDESHVQDCLDTYRDWLCARSVCPRCDTRSLQQPDLHTYQCFNCHAVWCVTPSRFCRAYRGTKRAAQSAPTAPLSFHPVDSL